MPKLKSHSGAKKRFFINPRGKIKRKKAYARHILTGKAPKRMRKLRKAGSVSAGEAKKIRILLPYA